MRLIGRLAAALATMLGAAASGAAFPAAAESEGLELDLRRAAGVAVEAPVELVLEPADEAAPARRLAVAGRHRLELPADFTGRIGCRGDGYWCPRLDTAAESSPLILPVFRAARLGGRVVPNRDGAPDELLVEGTVPIPGLPNVKFQQWLLLSENDEFALTVPRGELDLRFAADGWAPIYRWGVEVEDATEQVGELRFERGSSVSGFVVQGSNELPLAGARVRALPASVVELTEDARGRLEALAVGEETNERGFFQLTGLPAGRYRLAFEIEGFFPAEPPLVQVVENSESHLAEPIALFPAARLTVVVDPPRPPGDPGWQVELVPRTGAGTRRALTDDRGAADFERLTPGSYRVELGTAEHPTVWQQEVQLSSDRIVTADVPLVELVGSVQLAGEPLSAAEITIETGSRDRWRYRSDEEGRFGGILRVPRFDVLFVRIEADDPVLGKSLEIRGPKVDDGVVELDLTLDDRTIEGTVVDGVGHPVADATVRVHAGDRLVARVTTDDEGAFAARALDRGRYTVQAEARGRGSSEVVQADLSALDRAGPFRLMLVRQQRIEGVLRTADGRPVQGARIEAHTWQPVPYADVGHTDLAGHFWLSVPDGARRAHLKIEASSAGLIAVCASFPSPEEGIELVLPRSSEVAVELDLATRPDLPPAWIGPLVLVRRGGGYLSTAALRRWGRTSGGSSFQPWVVRGLFPGEYALAWLDGPSWFKAATVCEAGYQPSWQYVGPGGTLRLHYDVEPHQRAASGAASN